MNCLPPPPPRKGFVSDAIGVVVVPGTKAKA